MSWILFVCCLMVLPLLTVGVIRKTKALLQNRIGPPVIQPFLDLLKLFRKSELISDDSSWIFRVSTISGLSVLLAIATMVPWISIKPTSGNADLFLIIYLMATVRFFTILAAMDTGSPFGAFSSGREATLSLLVEPAVVLALIAPALFSQSSDLNQSFAFSTAVNASQFPTWILAGAALFLASIVELSRMPVDDPTTHLELTMLHEAMVIENSGPNLAIIQLTYALKMIVYYGLTVQCFLHAVTSIVRLDQFTLNTISVVGVLFLAVLTSVMETVMVKLKWTKCPEFIAYALTMGLLACMTSISAGGANQ